jgi:murein DD-endopeptidase MepM/ murein hydrolase activator NlpD
MVAAFTAANVPYVKADDDINSVLKRIEDLNRAIQVSRQNAERYRLASQQYQSAVSSANRRIAELADQERSATSEADQVAAEVSIAEEQLALVTLQLNETVAYVGSLNASIDEGTKQLARREELYGQHLRQLYRQYRITPLEMLLGSSSLADFAERVQLMMLIARQDQELAGAIRHLRESQRDMRASAQLKQSEIEGLRLQISDQHARLSSEKRRLLDLIADTEDARDQTDAYRRYVATKAQDAQNAQRNFATQAQELERQKLAAEALYTQLAARLQGSSGLRTPWPVAGRLGTWPLAGPITSYFGPRWGGFHNGLDIAAPMYTPIRAASAGLVQVVGQPYIAYGDTAEVVIIAHATNMSTLYGHLDIATRAPIVRPGQFVQAGQIIAYVGMTGWTTGPHLHFMTIYNGKATDPLGFLP